MKDIFSLKIMLFLLPALVVTFGCEENTPDQKNDIQTVTIEYWGGSFKMVYCPGGTFLTNDDDGDMDFEDGPELTVDPFWVSESEVSNELLAWIYNCASGLDIVQGAITGGQPIFNTEDINAPNYLCDSYVKWGGQPLIYMGGSELYGYHDITRNGGFEVRSGLQKLPCTDITWYGSVMACNWLTEHAAYPGQLSKVYSGIDEEWWDNETECSFGRNGFRLLTSAEWECAARWQGNDNTGDCYEYPPGSGQFWTRGGCASGAVTSAENAVSTSKVAVYRYNETGFQNPDDVQDIIGNRIPNSLGIYDMSGNTWEWCFDESVSGRSRVLKGGSAFCSYHDIRICSSWDMIADGTASDLGFRLAMSAE